MITGSYPPMRCGVGAYTQKLAATLAEFDDMEITVLTDERAGAQVEPRGFEVLSVVKGWAMAELFRVYGVIKNLNPDIIHIQYPTQGFSGKIAPKILPLLIRFFGKPCLQTWHESVIGRAGLLQTIGLRNLITPKSELKTGMPKLVQMTLKSTKLTWIPGASLLPTVRLSTVEKANLRQPYISGSEPLLAFYGFVAPLKGIEILFEVVAKINVRLLMVCDFQSGDDYHQLLLDKITAMGISSRVTVLGFLPNEELAKILASSDAVVLPFRDGAGEGNTTIDGAMAQGTFVLTTSQVTSGYNKEENIYFAKPGNVEEMITAIHKYAGQRVLCKSSVSEWKNIARQHVDVYQQLIDK